MAKLVLTDAYIKVGAVNLSDHCSSIEIKDEADAVDITGFTKRGYKEYAQGLKDARITATFYSDYAAGSVHQTLEPAYESGDPIQIEIRPTSKPVSATNPTAVLISRIMAYSGGISGQVGSAATLDALFVNADQRGLRWLTVPTGTPLLLPFLLGPTEHLGST